MTDQPIADHGLLSNCHGAALVDRRGSIEWWCPSRFDGPSVFARLLDDDAGHFRVGPVRSAEGHRRYRDGTLLLETTFSTSSGTVVLTDALAMAVGVRGHDLGAGSPHVLLRRATCTEGTVELEVEYAPRLEYGLTFPLLRRVEQGVSARGGAVALRLSTSAQLQVDGPTARGRVELSAGGSVGFAVEHASSWEPVRPPWSQTSIAARLDDTAAAWRSWEGQHQHYQGPYAHLVRHSGKILQALTYQPTGAMVAAATTSLPEVVGGDRNWDYRYAWVRDASFTLDALWVAACPDEAGTFLQYLTTAASSIHQRDQLQIMFGVGGERDLAERTLDHLRGWRGSRPVRVGNGAWKQRQIDVYGELIAAVHRLRGQIGDLDDPARRLLIALADRAAAAWTEPDQGIWEVRGEPRHYLYSKLMCWVALDRAVELADVLRAGPRLGRWRRTRDEIRAAILEHGWSHEAGAFTRSFGDTALDASNLVIPLVGFLPADDPRVLTTIDATERDLTDAAGRVYRYRADDGLEGQEGTFLLCTFWLAEALAHAGRVQRAREVFDLATSSANDLGLLSEQVDPTTGELLGNFPQAFSHIGLVNAAWAIARAERGEFPPTEQEIPW
ncbi:MAG TPA: glycoside hydrolase family 15 protein [Nitriliruptorales bacterium]|nr:glycoside hydrolase family 15 protein [Nitriliruptorales bacterium]